MILNYTTGVSDGMWLLKLRKKKKKRDKKKMVNDKIMTYKRIKQ